MSENTLPDILACKVANHGICNRMQIMELSVHGSARLSRLRARKAKGWEGYARL